MGGGKCVRVHRSDTVGIVLDNDSDASDETDTPEEAPKRRHTDGEVTLVDHCPKEHARSRSSPSLPAASGVVLVDDVNPTWEIEQNGHFSRFNKDCEGYIEKKYQDYTKNSGEARVKVRTEGKEVSVDFNKMTAYSKGFGVQTIRRFG